MPIFFPATLSDWAPECAKIKTKPVGNGTH